MTNGGDSAPESRPAAREAARERARELREQHRKRDRRRRLFVQGGIVVGTVAVLAIVAIVLLTFTRPATRGPLNMQSDGIKIGEGLVAERTGGVPPEGEPRPFEENPPGIVDIRIYVDYLCATCGTFQRENGDDIRAWVESGAATVEIHPVAMLTNKSAGTHYSRRAANAAACVAEHSPDRFLAFHEALFEDQPEEGTPGLTNAQLVERARDAGVAGIGQVRSCVEEKRFRSWVQEATERAIAGPIPGTDLEGIPGTPTIIVNGEQFTYSSTFDPNEFRQFVLVALGDVFNENPTPSPTPTPTADED